MISLGAVLLLDAAREGIDVIRGMLIVGLIFLGVIFLGQFVHWQGHRRAERRRAAGSQQRY